MSNSKSSRRNSKKPMLSDVRLGLDGVELRDGDEVVVRGHYFKHVAKLKWTPTQWVLVFAGGVEIPTDDKTLLSKHVV